MGRSKKIAPLTTDLGPDGLAENLMALSPSKLSPNSRFKRINFEFTKALDESSKLKGSAKNMTNLISLSLSAFKKKSVGGVAHITSEKHARVVRELLLGARRIQVQKAEQRLAELKDILDEREKTVIKITLCKDPHGARIREPASTRTTDNLEALYEKSPVRLNGKIVPFSECAIICNNQMAPLGDSSVTMEYFNKGKISQPNLVIKQEWFCVGEGYTAGGEGAAAAAPSEDAGEPAVDE